MEMSYDLDAMISDGDAAFLEKVIDQENYNCFVRDTYIYDQLGVMKRIMRSVTANVVVSILANI